ncbi:MAG: hypothetical protein U1E27_05705, partial [Kiritimatiellia bacterium]|nr:hypothetical protein [Kiritimatiellia bacterium]
MNGALSALAIGSLVFVLVPIGFLFVRVAGGAFKNRRWTKIDRGILTAGILLLSILFLRPHQHVYQALDSSAFRHMARAFEAGRGLQDPDPAFAYLPREIRPWVMLDPFCFEHGERPTRDRSFQLDGLDDAGTRPFFYPMLSLNMAALSELSRGRLRDYFIPLLSLLFWIAMSIVAGGRAGWRGILFTLALVVASPLPVWLGRGCYLESVSAVLLGLAILSWISLDADESPPVAAFWAVGLAVTYHPIMILPALPLGVALLFSCRHRRAGWAGVGFGILGIAPLFAMTEWICAPYGALRAGSLKAAILHNAYIRPAFVLVVLLAVGLLSVLFWIRSGRWNPRIPRNDRGRAAGDGAR